MKKSYTVIIYDQIESYHPEETPSIDIFLKEYYGDWNHWQEILGCETGDETGLLYLVKNFSAKEWKIAKTILDDRKLRVNYKILRTYD